ncbi:MAG: membrane protein insertase YidC [Candidatus Symbiothrix sp.]|jgi:YidC/Oxa1 family membrane protein insertase|nr:membrane protein insertase YidC [Candidatus Symbiothrix sp.]
MDKNTVTGFVLIVLVLVGFWYLNRPSQEQIEAQKRYQDSIAIVAQSQMAEQQAAELRAHQNSDSLASKNVSDAEQELKLVSEYGDFAVAVEGEESFFTLENELMIIKISTKGGRVYSVQLKDFKNYEDEPLMLFDGDESAFSTTLVTANNRVINTGDLYFTVSSVDSLQVRLSLKAGENASIDYIYTLHPDNYMVDFAIVPNNMGKVISSGSRTLDISWKQKIRQQEKGRSFEDRYARLNYKYLNDDVEELRESKDDAKDIPTKLKWIGFKDQYFSSVLIAQGSFEASQLASTHLKDNAKYLKDYSAVTSVEFDPETTQEIPLNFYFGPNDYNLLKTYDKTQFQGQDLQLEKLVPLGWSLFRYVNKWIIIPIFDWLTHWISSIGLAIFVLTLIIKIGLFPLIYKSFMSSAKMRVMKPQIEEISKKFPGQENAMNRQQKTMELYRQVGINPMSGCLPMLLQMPILLALFMFFPTAIELRHESFLWAKDLATYDDIISWKAYIPFVTPYFGNHVSLFCLLMTITNVFYTKFNMEQANTGQEQMPGMKTMMYIMPVFMLFILNSYPAGLNYYYCISSLITILQTLLFRYFLNEEAILLKLEANKKKPVKKKSGFMARLEEAQRKQQAALKEQQKQQGKNKGRK